MEGQQIGKFTKAVIYIIVFTAISLLLIHSSLIQPKLVSASDIEPLAKKSSPKPTPVPTPTRTPTPNPTLKPSPTAIFTPSPTPNHSPVTSPTPSQTRSPTPTPAPTSTSIPTTIPTQTPASTPSPAPTTTPTTTNTPTSTPEQTPTLTQISTPNPPSTPSLIPEPTPTPKPIFNSTTLKATLSNGSIVDLRVKGISALAVTNALISTDQVTAKTTLSLTIIGQNEINNLNNITVPKTAINYDATPKIYVNLQVTPDQGFSQDSNNYYIWYKTVFSNYELSIVFTTKVTQDVFPIAVILSMVIFFSVSVTTILLQKKKGNCGENIDYLTYS